MRNKSTTNSYPCFPTSSKVDNKFGTQFKSLPQDSCFLDDILIETTWSRRTVTVVFATPINNKMAVRPSDASDRGDREERLSRSPSPLVVDSRVEDHPSYPKTILIDSKSLELDGVLCEKVAASELTSSPESAIDVLFETYSDTNKDHELV